MNQNMQHHRHMLAQVADALGENLRNQMAFVGGCTTGLLLTDALSLEYVRYTDDVDLIVHVIGYTAYGVLQNTLSQRGFRHSVQANDPICTMRLGALRVDFMPDDPAVLGFSNRWYAKALETATNYRLHSDLVIRLVSPAYFVATKLEAYLGRGNNDPLGSQDIEDLLSIINGRSELLAEIQEADLVLRQYMSTQLSQLLHHMGFADAIQDCMRGDDGRTAIVLRRIQNIIALAPCINNDTP